MAKRAPIIPFNEFKETLHSASLEKMASKKSVRKLNVNSFDEIRDYLISYYEYTESVHSFRDQEGQVWDCIPIHLQPFAGDRNTAPIEPPDLSNEFTGLKYDRVESFLEQRKKDAEGNEIYCPPGNVPIRRMTIEDVSRFENLKGFRQKAPRHTKNESEILHGKQIYIHKYAHAYQQVKNLGGASIMSIWRPVVKSTETFSLCQHWFVGGPEDIVQTVEAGWQVYPQRYGTIAPCLFIYWTADGYHNTGAYNKEDHVFYQVSNKWALGGPLKFTQKHDSKPIELIFAWRLVSGKWWLYLNGLSSADAVGFYPASIYGNGPLSHYATSIDFGGEVVGHATSPQMGNSLYGDDFNAAYQRNITFFNIEGKLQNANLSQPIQSSNCFRAMVDNGAGWEHTLFYGGPGGGPC